MYEYIGGGVVLVILAGLISKVAHTVSKSDCEQHRDCIEKEMQKHMIILTEIKTEQKNLIDKFDKVTKITIKDE